MLANNSSLTDGSVWRKLVWFALPILVGNLFQQLYNTVDSIVVGNYVGNNALAAVGASTPLINLLIGFFMGLATGAGVVVSRYYGANKPEELSLSIHTFVAFSILSGILLMVIGILFSKDLLIMMGTPFEILEDSTKYIQIYFIGIIANMLYNAGSGILRAIGDSKRPLYFLIISVILNIILDLLFVIVFKMGVAGAAWATIICQTTSMILVFFTLMSTSECYRVCLNKIKIDWEMLKRIIRIGIPAGLQQVVISLSNVLVQSYVNGFNSLAIAGFSSGNKIDSLLGMFVQSSSLTITTFVSQNIGAERIDRVKKGIKICLLLTTIAVVTCGIPLFIYAEFIVGLFTPDVNVIAYGAEMVRTLVPFYVFLSYANIYVGALRGAGYSTVPMLTQIFSFCIIRQIFLYFMMRIDYDISIVFWSYSFTWVTAALSIAYYAYRSKWLQRIQRLD